MISIETFPHLAPSLSPISDFLRPWPTPSAVAPPTPLRPFTNSRYRRCPFSDSPLLSFLYLVMMTKLEEKPWTSPQSFIDQLVVLGDVVLNLLNRTNQTIKLGGGLRQDWDAISVTKAGKLRFSKPNKYWVETSQKRSVPCVEDHVLGIVVDCNADNFLVDVKGPTLAFLPVLAFEGGIRCNIPRFETGTVLYARVVKTNAGTNPELSCMDASGKAAEFGPLKDGYMFESSTGLSRIYLTGRFCEYVVKLSNMSGS